jgi:transposase
VEELIKLLDENLEYMGHEITGNCIHVKIGSTRTEVECPFCTENSGKTHSTYKRSFQDLQVQGMKVILVLNNRKMICRNRDCAHTTFAERFDFLSGKSKKTKRLEAEIVRLSLNLSSVAASKVLSQSVASIGKSTICRLLKKGREEQC